MTSYSMDENWNLVRDPATERDICGWADVYQSTYFTHRDPGVKIALVDDTGGTACFNPENRIAYIDRAITRYEKCTKIALLHEMVHINLFLENGDADGNHGPRFRSEIKRLMEAGAYDNLL